MAMNENKLFAYPVLNNSTDDFINVSYTSQTTKTLLKKKKISIINYMFDIDDCDLKKLINTGKAQAIVKIYCSSTKFREIYNLNYGNNEIVLNNKDVNNRIELSSYIILLEDIVDYHCENFNKDYGDTKFNLKKGSIIAIGSNENVFIEKDIHEFTKLSSVIKVRMKAVEDKGMEIDFSEDGHKIYINLNKEDYIIYNKYAKHFLDVANSMIIIPAIVYVLDMVTNECKEDDNFYPYETFKWFRVFKNKVEKIYDAKFLPSLVENVGSIDIAQNLLEFPLSPGLEWIRDHIDESGDK